MTQGRYVQYILTSHRCWILVLFLSSGRYRYLSRVQYIILSCHLRTAVRLRAKQYANQSRQQKPPSRQLLLFTFRSVRLSCRHAQSYTNLCTRLLHCRSWAHASLTWHKPRSFLGYCITDQYDTLGRCPCIRLRFCKWPLRCIRLSEMSTRPPALLSHHTCIISRW